MDNVAQQLDQVLADMQGTADEARELIKEAEKRWYYVRSPSEESAVLAGQIALGNERLNLLNQWIEKISAIRAAVGGEGVDVDAEARRLFELNSAGWAVKAEWDELHPQTRELWHAHALKCLNPPATVDVGALRELVEKWRAESKVDATEGKNKEWAEWLRERHMGAAGARWKDADELAAMIGKEA